MTSDFPHLSQLLAGVDMGSPSVDPPIKGLCQDSRRLKPGELFFAYPGTQSDGRYFLQEAIRKGASAILLESEALPVALPPISIPCIPISHLVEYLGPIAARFYGYPSRHLPVVGITGTNGKTSCTQFLADCLQQRHQSCGVIGSLGYGFYGHLKPALLTTPNAIELQRVLAEFQARDAKAVAMEVSSHRLAQRCLNGMEFSIAAFTNLTRDHLDYHGTMADYAQAKRSFFDLSGIQQAVLNADDPYGQYWLKELAGRLPVYAYSLSRPSASLSDISSIYVKQANFPQEGGLCAELSTPWGDLLIANPFLMGRFNLSNLLLVVTVLKRLNFSLSEISDVISKVKGVAGRMQAFRSMGKPLVVVDYAHTPHALQQVLSTLRPYCSSLLYCIFGCGGNRDRGKRALMAHVVEQWADHIILTNDNPRNEDAGQIIQDIQRGLSGAKPVYCQQDRRLAIAYAIEQAKPEDVILVAGKGHEAYQLIQGNYHPFNDATIVKSILYRNKPLRLS